MFCWWRYYFLFFLTEVGPSWERLQQFLEIRGPPYPTSHGPKTFVTQPWAGLDCLLKVVNLGSSLCLAVSLLEVICNVTVEALVLLAQSFVGPSNMPPVLDVLDLFWFLAAASL